MINQSQTLQNKTLRALLPGDALTGGGTEGGKKAALAEIDASCRVPVLFFFLSGLAWLLAVMQSFSSIMTTPRRPCPNSLQPVCPLLPLWTRVR
jgi:hypothetical protein